MKGLLASFVAFHDYFIKVCMVLLIGVIGRLGVKSVRGCFLQFSRNLIIVRGRKPAKNIGKHLYG